MAKRSQASGFVNKLTDEDLVEIYRHMRTEDMTSEEGREYILEEYCPDELEGEEEQSKFVEGVWRKIFVNNEKQPGSSGIIPMAIRTVAQTGPFLSMADALTSLTWQQLQEKAQDNPQLQSHIKTINAAATKQKVSPEKCWKESMLGLTKRAEKRRPALAYAQKIMAACDVSEEGNYWTPGRGSKNIMAAAFRQEESAGINLATLGRLFQDLSGSDTTEE